MTVRFDPAAPQPQSAPVEEGRSAIETEHTFRETRGPLWRAEPFRIFFPLGVVLGWIGVSHWLPYGIGLHSTYSIVWRS